MIAIVVIAFFFMNVKVLQGVITDVNPREYVCTVRTREEGSHDTKELKDVPFLSTSVRQSDGMGAFDIPERFSACLILCTGVSHYVMALVPGQTNIMNDLRVVGELNYVLTDEEKLLLSNQSITKSLEDKYTSAYATLIPRQVEGQESAHFVRKTLISSISSRPHDTIVGDKVFHARGGSFLGILRGGLIIEKVSEFCQFIMNRTDHLFRLISRNMQVFSDWGRIDVTNNKNATNMSLKIGQSYSDNAQEKFVVYLDVGSEGSLVKIKITDTEQVPLMTSHIKTTGEVDTWSKERMHAKSEHSMQINLVDIEKAERKSSLHLHQDGRVTLDSETEQIHTSVSGMSHSSGATYTAVSAGNMSLTTPAKFTAGGNSGSCIGGEGGSQYQVESNGDMHLDSTNNVTIDATGAVTISTSGAITLDAGGSIDLNGSDVRVNGSSIGAGAGGS